MKSDIPRESGKNHLFTRGKVSVKVRASQRKAKGKKAKPRNSIANQVRTKRKSEHMLSKARLKAYTEEAKAQVAKGQAVGRERTRLVARSPKAKAKIAERRHMML